MSFDLRVYFTGLCLFAPDPRDGRMHIVMPVFNDGSHEHHARLVYDVAHLVRGASHFARSQACVTLTGSFLELLFGRGLNPTLPEEIVSLDPLLDPEKLSRMHVSDAPDPALVASRITMDSGIISDYEPGVHFTFGGPTARRMTWRAEWNVRGIPGDRLTIALKPFQPPFGLTPTAPAPTDLFPIGDTIRLFIFNATCEDLPPRESLTPSAPIPVPHFGGYYRLYRSGTGKPLPRISGFTPPSADCNCTIHTPDPEEHHIQDVALQDTDADIKHRRVGATTATTAGSFGGRPFTCMIAQATLAGA